MSVAMTEHSEYGAVAYGDVTIAYEVVRKVATAKTKVGKVLIKVHPDQRVVATAPEDTNGDAIEQAVLKRAAWIWESIQAFASQQDTVLSKHYVSGETEFYLGRRYLLKILTEENKVARVKMSRGKLNVTLHATHAHLPQEQRAVHVRQLVNTWYQRRAKVIFHQRLNAMLIKATWVEGLPSFRVTPMKKQWGSCSAQGRLMLNPHLVKASKECIDYVILHELCHIAEHNHGEKFWRLLTQVMPNWKEVKARLDDMAEMYLNE